MNPDSETHHKLRQRFKEETRQAILSAAEEVYARDGLAGGRLESVAARAGVSVGTLYNYFADRDDLIASLLAARRAEMLARLDQALAGAPADPEARLRLYLLNLFEHFAAHRPLLALFAQAEPSGSLIVSAARSSSKLAELTARAGAIVRLGLERGWLRDDDPEILATILTGMTRAVLLRSLASGEPLEPACTAERIARLFARGAAA